MTLDPLVVFGAIGTILTGVTAAGLAGKWVFGWVYKAKATESDMWRDMFLKSLGQTDAAVGVAKKAAAKKAADG